MTDEREQSELAGRGGGESVSGASSVPLFRIVNADATPEEIAALVVVFSALGSGGSNGAPRRTPEWSRPARRLRGPVAHGPGGWRASSLPH